MQWTMFTNISLPRLKHGSPNRLTGKHYDQKVLRDKISFSLSIRRSIGDIRTATESACPVLKVGIADAYLPIDY